MSDTPIIPAGIPEAWIALVDAHCAGTLESDQRVELNDLLRREPAARMFYLAYLDLHAQMRWDARGANETLPPMTFTNEPKRRIAWPSRFAAAALILLSLILGVNFYFTQSPAAPAVLIAASNARFVGPAADLPVGAALAAGPLELSQGLAQIRFADGAEMLLEGPSRIELVRADRAALHFGRAVTRVPPAAVGFTVDTPRLTVVDLGTEFGLDVGANGASQVQVFEGQVIAHTRTAAAVEHRLSAGQALEADDTAPQALRPVAFDADRFVRRFPMPARSSPPSGPLYNRSRFDAVHVVPAVSPPAIDGDLSDWDASGLFRSACVEPYASDYFVEGMMMYDADHLYIAARVGDPAPMRNQRDPSADPGWLWAGGSVIVRLATDPALGYPLDAIASAARTRTTPPDAGHRPQDTTDRIASIVLWYHQPTHQPRLQVVFGIDHHQWAGDLTGWQGAFRRSPDGRSYTLEYAIPWSVLRAAEDHPRAGDAVACSWNVHWSDELGRISRGHLVEITSPSAQPYLFLNGSTWGRAIFHDAGHLPPGTVQPQLR
ncbi:MAG: hypothetical protein GC162_06925 [Planctomycetes bacterium]|nr:hypothetical protein [Planctomycetota bacterium]